MTSNGDLDHIVGFIHLKDVLRQHYLGWQLELKKLIRPAFVVPETMRLDQLMVRFQQERNQLAVVVDEFGATRGMVTLEDVVEELVGVGRETDGTQEWSAISIAPQIPATTNASNPSAQ